MKTTLVILILQFCMAFSAGAAEPELCPEGTEEQLYCRASPTAEWQKQDHPDVAGLFDRVRLCQNSNGERILYVAHQEDDFSSPPMPALRTVHSHTGGQGLEERYDVPTRLGRVRFSVWGEYARFYFELPDEKDRFERTYRSLECRHTTTDHSEEFPPASWAKRLSQAIYWKMHWELEAVVKGPALACGEVDPFEIGDACLIPIEISDKRRGPLAEAPVQEDAILYMDVADLPSDGLETGARIRVRSLLLPSKEYGTRAYYAVPASD